MTSQYDLAIVTRARKRLDIDFIHGDIHGQMCNKITKHGFYLEINSNLLFKFHHLHMRHFVPLAWVLLVTSRCFHKWCAFIFIGFQRTLGSRKLQTKIQLPDEDKRYKLERSACCFISILRTELGIMYLHFLSSLCQAVYPPLAPSRCMDIVEYGITLWKYKGNDLNCI